MANLLPAALSDLDEYVAHALQAWDVPGLALAIVKDDALVHARGYGRRELGRPDPVDADTLFATGSNTKAFTATALGLLVHEGKLSWDDPVTRYLPGFELYDPYVTHAITVRDLLCHRCGLATWAGDFTAYGSIYTRAEVLQRVRHIRPAFGFRAGFGYSNLMFLAAGQIIPAVTGQSWEDFVAARLLKPLGMVRSTLSVQTLANAGDVATPHTRAGERLVAVPYRAADPLAPAGALNSSARDMAQWLRLQLGDGEYAGTRLVDAAVIEETRIPHTPMRLDPMARELFPTRHFSAYGLGWFLADHHGRLLVSHGGGIDGMLSQCGFVPEERLGVVVLTNYDHHALHNALFSYVIDAYLGAASRDSSAFLLERFRQMERQLAQTWQQAEAARVPRTQPSLPLDAYTGTYVDTVYGTATIAVEDGALCLRLGGHPDVAGRLEHWHYDTFLCRWSDPVLDRSLVPFTLDAQGKAVEFKLQIRPEFIDPLEYAFRRVQA